MRTFVPVTLPLRPRVSVAGLLLVFIPLAGDYITAAVLGGRRATWSARFSRSPVPDGQNNALGSAVAVVLIISIFW